ncbi:hypothetical protein [Flavobacterium sp.]|uniref:hypothetical protein n=1 Tax=Flavobacterium sp. TaxID=239 RepID=UPI0026271D4F|nr:hypothetical protein [Flavobacterium sp.]
MDDINSVDEVYKRMIKAFSVGTIKEIFNLTEYKERQQQLVNRIVETNTKAQIETAIFNNFSLLKQHVYVYNYIGVLPANYMSANPYLKSINKVNNNHTIYNFLFPTTFAFFNKGTNEVNSIDFIIPVQIHKNGTKLLVFTNILERNLASIISDKVVAVTRDVKDDTILNNFVESTIQHKVQLTKCDLNRGIKKLWADDEVDAFKVKFKKHNSTSSEIMDEDKLLKKDMPDVYKELIKTPLIQTESGRLFRQFVNIVF